ncbi:RDD family protein [Plantactinospora sp. ZYX-F-223]|uniref:RDD family protein n=1 Tax=Plantactinospora sp. ZYX-F-223 TaxID=3144103 RepID=UPI0031FE0CF4
MAQPAYPVPVAPDGRPLAGLGQRLGARIIDSIIVMVALLVVAGIIIGGGVALLSAAIGEDSPILPITAIVGIIAIVVGLQYVYEIEIPLRWNGQTLGKRMLKVAVTPLEAGTPLRRGQLTYRYLVMLGFNLLSNCYIGLLDPLWCLWDKPYRQCLHDKPAKTVVVKVDPAAQPPRY